MYGGGEQGSITTTIGIIAAALGVIATIVYIVLLSKGVRSLQDIVRIIKRKL